MSDIRRRLSGPPPSGLSMPLGAKIRIFAMIGLLILVIGMMIHLGTKFNQTEQIPEIRPETDAYARWRSSQGEEFHKMTSQIIDGGIPIDESDWTFEKEWFRYFARMIREMPSSEVTRLVNPRLSAADLIIHPESYRGHFVRIQGALRKGPDVTPVHVTNPENITNLLRWIIIDQSTERVVYAYSSHFDPVAPLAAPVAATDTLLAVGGDGIDRFPPAGEVRLGDELIQFGAIEKNVPRDGHSDKPHHHLTGCTRPQPRAHSGGTCVLKLNPLKDAVQIEGMFLRIHPYETNERKSDGTFKVKNSVLFLIKNVRWVNLDSPRHLMTTLIVIAAAISIFSLLLIGYIQRRGGKETPLHSILLSAKLKRRSSGSRPGTSSEPKEPPAPPPASEDTPGEPKPPDSGNG